MGFGRGGEQEEKAAFLALVPECLLDFCMSAVAQQASQRKGNLPTAHFCSLSGKVHALSQGTWPGCYFQNYLDTWLFKVP